MNYISTNILDHHSFIYLRTFSHSFIVKRSIEKVWNFYTDVEHLEKITPKKIDLRIINVTNQKIIQGQEIWLSGKIAIKIRRARWHSKITLLKPYEYVDEMLTGPFKKWKHIHKFQSTDDKQTEVIDVVEFELPYNIIGKLFEGYAYKQLQDIFEHRKLATINSLENY
ncbi:MAG: SRPBCC family protein [Candidatus Nitrosocosmicus sp.]